MRILVFLFCIFTGLVLAQDRPNNGVPISKPGHYLLTDAEIIVSPTTIIPKGSILIKDNKIITVGTKIKKPDGAVEINCEGKTIIASFIELNAEIGMPKDKAQTNNLRPQMDGSRESSYYWNDAIRPEFNAGSIFTPNQESNKLLNSMGFGFALTHDKDGIMRGSGAVIALGSSSDYNALISNESSAHFSFDKGSSQQSYPSSQMGSIALLRQTLYDFKWYENQSNSSPNISLDALKGQLKKPLFFETNDCEEIFRAQKIANEFQLPFNYFGSGDEYEQLENFKQLKGTIVVPISFPTAYDVKNPYVNKEIPLSILKKWELAPSNPFLLVSNGNTVCISMLGCKNEKEFWANIKKCMSRGLSLAQTIAALTLNPAQAINIQDKMGSLEQGKFASFSVYSSNPFNSDADLMESWILGEQQILKTSPIQRIDGSYSLVIDGISKPIEISQKEGKYSAKYDKANPKMDKSVNVAVDGNDVTIQFNDSINGYTGSINLQGKINVKLGVMEGDGTLPSGRWVKWSAIKLAKGKIEDKPENKLKIDSNYISKIWFPNMAYGRTEKLEPKTFVIKNVTVWTNEKEGVLKDATVILQNSKITFVGTGGFSTPEGAIEIDGKGMHLTSGIIDEHSHIAISKGVNEGGQAVTSEVSIGDVVTNSDINIYRQLAGGVTIAQLLHGSANPIGGQSAIIKLKWGMPAEQMLLPNAPKFIKFALGENVKQSNWGDFQTVRFPQTRMGVEQVYIDGFTRAQEYQQQRLLNGKNTALTLRRDLELDVLVEILKGERNITCHSYVQSEINMLMHVAESFGFKINTFTHILEGYKVADKMAKHGAGGSTFADWWAYKFEVNDAIPQNAKMMSDQGIVVAINSDDAEMGRRLNQEAAKSVKYGGMSEEDAWKLVTLNPAKLLNVSDRLGSVKVGKDADVVLWTDNPLSLNAIPDKVFIDGMKFFDRAEDALLRIKNQEEKARIISKMLEADKNGEATKEFNKEAPKYFHCDTFGEEGSAETNTH